MYGVESMMHADYRGVGVGSLLMNARFDLLKRLNLRGMIAGGIIMDYAAAYDAEGLSPDQYVREVIAGKRFDTNLTKQLHKGFRVASLIPNYDEDPRSYNWGVALVWDNPDYRATGRILRGSFAPVAPPVRAYRASGD